MEFIKKYRYFFIAFFVVLIISIGGLFLYFNLKYDSNKFKFSKDALDVLAGKDVKCRDSLDKICNLNSQTITNNSSSIKESGTIDIVLFMGQSNMYGQGGKIEDASVTPIDGSLYTFSDSKNATGIKKINNKNDELSRTLVPAFVNSYYNNTGHSVFAVHYAYSGTSIDKWVPGSDLFKVAMYRLDVAKKEISNTNLKIGRVFAVWYQGEADTNNIVSIDKRAYLEEAEYKSLKKEYLDNFDSTPIVYAKRNVYANKSLIDFHYRNSIERNEYKRKLNLFVDGLKEKSVEKLFMINIGYITSINTKFNINHFAEYNNMRDVIYEYASSTPDAVLVSNISGQLSLSKDIMSDQVHLSSKALEFVGTEAGINTAFYYNNNSEPVLIDDAYDCSRNERGDAVNCKRFVYNGYKKNSTLTNAQKDALVQRVEHFISNGNKKNLLKYGSYREDLSYNFQLASYFLDYRLNGKSTTPSLGKSTTKHPYNSSLVSLETYVSSSGTYVYRLYNNEQTLGQAIKNNKVGFEGNPVLFSQKQLFKNSNVENYIGLECSGFTSTMFKYVYGLDFSYVKAPNSKTSWMKSPWSTTEYYNNMIYKDLSGNNIQVFKTLFHKISTKNEYTISNASSYLAVNGAKLEVGDLIIGYNSMTDAHVVIYLGKDANGRDIIAQSAQVPINNMDNTNNMGISYLDINNSHPYSSMAIFRLSDNILPKNMIANNFVVNFDKLNANNSIYEKDIGYLASSISFNDSTVKLNLSETKRINPSFVGVNGKNAYKQNSAYIWSCSNTSVATVDSGGNVTAVGEGTATITIKSKYNNVSGSYNVLVESNGPQKPVVQLSDNYVSGKWTNKNVTITVNVASQNSISKFQFYNNKQWVNIKDYWKDAVISNNGRTIQFTIKVPDNTSKKYNFIFRTVDSKGKSGVQSDVVKVNIDKVKPTVPKVNTYLYKDKNNPPSTYKDASSVYTPGKWTFNYVYAFASDGSDSDSGFSHYEYLITKDGNEKITTSNYSFITEDGVTSVKFRTCDKAGNCSNYSKESKVMLDNNPPVVPKVNTYYYLDKNNPPSTYSEASGVYTPNTWIKGYVYAFASDGVDYGSGFNHYEYLVNGVAKKSHYSFITNDGTSTVAFRACDNSGMCSAYSNAVVIKIDNTPPTVPVAEMFKFNDNNVLPSGRVGLQPYTAGSSSNKFIVAFASSTDNLSGIDHYTYNVTGAVGNRTNDLNYQFFRNYGTSTISFKACDKVGNCSAFSNPAKVVIVK